MKTITDYANEYVGHPQEIDEDLSVYQKREAYKAGMEKAFDIIYDITNECAENSCPYPLIVISTKIIKMLVRKENKK